MKSYERFTYHVLVRKRNVSLSTRNMSSVKNKKKTYFDHAALFSGLANISIPLKQNTCVIAYSATFNYYTVYCVLYYVVYPRGINAFWNFQINICSVLFCSYYALPDANRSVFGEENFFNN